MRCSCASGKYCRHLRACGPAALGW
ncbi:hypothetical protein DW682_00385 [Collinsella intestinalis]|uniref:Uncharacterized protein n=1 Tax=Collinsella intestinalis TaxID=147207 RepID=A0A414NHG9_9ACTN|nr:hypothetical protein DW682_00385 [Collinsella intestinalis]